MFKVKIKKVSIDTYWYAKLVGRVFWVSPTNEKTRYQVFLAKDSNTGTICYLNKCDVIKLKPKAREKSPVRQRTGRTTTVLSHKKKN